MRKTYSIVIFILVISSFVVSLQIHPINYNNNYNNENFEKDIQHEQNLDQVFAENNTATNIENETVLPKIVVEKDNSTINNNKKSEITSSQEWQQGEGVLVSFEGKNNSYYDFIEKYANYNYFESLYQNNSIDPYIWDLVISSDDNVYFLDETYFRKIASNGIFSFQYDVESDFTSFTANASLAYDSINDYVGVFGFDTGASIGKVAVYEDTGTTLYNIDNLGFSDIVVNPHDVKFNNTADYHSYYVLYEGTSSTYKITDTKNDVTFSLTNPAYRIALDTDYIYVAGINYYEKILYNGTSIETITTNESGFPEDIYVTESYIYLISESKIIIFDKTTDTKLGSVDLDETIYAMTRKNNKIILAMESSILIEQNTFSYPMLLNEENMLVDDSSNADLMLLFTEPTYYFTQQNTVYYQNIYYPKESGICYTINILLKNNTLITDTNSIVLDITSISNTYSDIISQLITLYYNYGNLTIFSSIIDEGSVIDSENIVYSGLYQILYVNLQIDYLWIEEEDYNSHLRSYFRVLPSDCQFEHYLTFENFRYGSEITISAPMSWNYSRIEPSATVTLDGDNYVITKVYPIQFKIYFLSGVGFGRDYIRQKEILAISDETDEYLQDPSFEYEINEINYGTGFEFDSMSLNHTIVYDGISSLRLEDTDVYSDLIVYKTSSSSSAITDIQAGFYYISYSYYVESFGATGDLQFGYYDGAWNYIQLDASTTNRWITVKFGVQITGDGYGRDIMPMKLNGASGVIFVDNFCFYKVNTEIETKIDMNGDTYNQITSVFNYWTNYGLFPAKNENSTLYLYDRTSQLQIDYYTNVTDDTGVISWNWYGNLEEREYEIRSVSWSSFYGTDYFKHDLTENKNVGLWSSGGLSATETITTQSRIGKYAIRYIGTTTASDNYLLFGNYGTYSLNIDISSGDYVVVWLKSNVTTGNIDSYYGFNINSSNFYLKSNIGIMSANIWTLYSFDVREYSNLYGVASLSSISIIRFDFDISNGVKVDLLIDGLHVIKSQKYYFTPKIVSQVDYAETEKEDSWDFSEGDNEGFRLCSSCTGYLAKYSVLENGSIKYYKSASDLTAATGYSSTLGVEVDSTIVSTNYYNTLSFRIYATKDIDVNFLREGEWGTVYGYPSTFIGLNKWNIVTISLASYANWLSDTSVNDLFIAFKTEDGLNFTTSDYLLIDWIKVSHQEFSSGYNWEFNEDETLLTSSYSYLQTVNGFTVDSTVKVSGTVDNGVAAILLDVGAAWNGIVTTLESSNQYTYAIVRAWCSADKRFSFYYGGGYKASIDLVSTPTTYLVTFSSAISAGVIQLENRETVSSSYTLYIDYIRFYTNTYPNLYEDSQNFFLVDEQTYFYKVWSDYNFLGVFSSFQAIPKDLSIGTHQLFYQAVDSASEYDCFLSSVVYSYSYEISEDGIMKIILHDQESNSLSFDSFRVFIDGIRLYDNYIYFTDINSDFNLTITDLFNNVLYQNTTEVFEQFKEIELTLYSVKVQNLQSNPIHLTIARGSTTWSEWLFSWEISKYYLEESSYTFTFYYGEANSTFYVTQNGTFVSYSYYVNTDTALRITGKTIEDVWGNTLTLNSSLIDINASIHTAIFIQSDNLTVQINALNSNFLLMGENITLLEANMQGNFTLLNSILNILDSSINGNFTAIQSVLNILDSNLNGNFTLLVETLAILDSSFDGNFTFIAQTLQIMDSSLEGNFTLLTTVLSVLDSSLQGNFTLINSTLNILNSNVLAIIEDLILIDSNLAGNFTFITSTLNIIDSNLASNFTTIISQNIAILGNVSILNSSLAIEFLNVYGNLTLLDSQLNTSTVNILNALITNTTFISEQMESNFTLLNSILNILDSNLDGNFTAIQSVLTILDSSLIGNFTIIVSLLEIFDSNLDGNFTIVVNILELLDSYLAGNFTLMSNLIQILDTSFEGNFTLLNSNLSGNFTYIVELIDMINTTFTGNFTFITDLFTVLDSNLEGNFSFLSDFLQLLDSSFQGNFSLISNILQILDSSLQGNFTLISNILEILDLNIFGNLTLLNSSLASNFLYVFGNLTLIDSQLNTSTVTILQALISNTTFLSEQLEGNFTILESTIISNNSVLYSQTISILEQIATLQGIYRVHFDLVDQLGIGLDWNTFFVYINGSRIYNQDIIFSNTSSALLVVRVSDGFNYTLLTENYTITDHQDISLTVYLYWVTFRNDGNYTSYLYITRNNIVSNYTIAPEQYLTVRMTEGLYSFSVYYFEYEQQNFTSSVGLSNVADYGKTLWKTGSFRVSTQLPSVVDVSAPRIEELQEPLNNFEQFWNGFTSGFGVTAVGAGIAGVILFVGLREGWMGFKVVALKEAPEDSLVTPNWMEERQDRLDSQMANRPRKYQNKQGKWY